MWLPLLTLEGRMVWFVHMKGSESWNISLKFNSRSKMWTYFGVLKDMYTCLVGMFNVFAFWFTVKRNGAFREELFVEWQGAIPSHFRRCWFQHARIRYHEDCRGVVHSGDSPKRKFTSIPLNIINVEWQVHYLFGYLLLDNWSCYFEELSNLLPNKGRTFYVLLWIQLNRCRLD